MVPAVKAAQVQSAEQESDRSPLRSNHAWGAVLWHGFLALIVAAPLMRGGYLLLLDFALVRRVAVVWQPTAATPGPVNSAPFEALSWVLTRLGYVAGPLLVFALFILMGSAA